ncbi:MAG: GNAT family N-acetyltransferase [Alteromonadaceae bacterium]|nr:GNAT family N-acetyltransferase [Alteromonadaceae bacterium]
MTAKKPLSYDVEIREARKADIVALIQLSKTVWLETYAIDGIKHSYLNFVDATFDAQYFQKAINDIRNAILVCQYDGSVVGYALIDKQSDYQNTGFDYELVRLYILAKYRGFGLGRRLLQALQKQYGTKFWLYTWTENKSNQFYLKLGATHLGQYTFDFDKHPVHNHVYGFTHYL